MPQSHKGKVEQGGCSSGSWLGAAGPSASPSSQEITQQGSAQE